MNTRKVLVYFILIILFSSVLTINLTIAEKNISFWNSEWSYREEIYIPISTKNKSAINQPIDISFEFKNPCWAKDTFEHSIRILCYHNDKWIELDSQIYDIEKIDSSNHINKCGIVFLIPSFADGTEKYFVYYDENSKEKPKYKDHVQIEDSYYFFEPITGVSAEGDYYKITEDGYCVFGIGQKGKVIHRRLSQTVIKLKPGTKDFDITKSDNIATFCFSYHKGKEYEDEISSDEVLIAKQILVDGNLMVEFKIISESGNKKIRTSNVYKYYYCPDEDKRINVRVSHEILEDDVVEGITNVDGRYGAIVSFQSKSEKIKMMRFGEILPFLHIYQEDGKIREYQMNVDPEDKEREWIIPYTDDCDLGKKAWFSYDEGETGKAQAIILRSNKNIIKNSKEDRDGIQMKVAVNEYMDALGAEIDYAAINYGRNSYEKGGTHDLKIRSGLLVEYDAEFYITEDGGYNKVIEEVNNYHKLIEQRKDFSKGFIEEEQKIHTLTVVPRLTGRILSHPFLANITGIKITEVYAELYKDNQLVDNKSAIKPIIGAPLIKFPKLAKGEYVVKVYRDIGRNIKLYIGLETVKIDKDKRIPIYCTWPKKLEIEFKDQKNNFIKDLEINILKNNTVVEKNISTDERFNDFIVPQNIFFDYQIICFYKGFKLIDEEIGILQKRINGTIKLYDLKINIRDRLDFPPGVTLKPYITSKDMEEEIRLYPENKEYGNYIFKKIPQGDYKFFYSYGSYSDQVDIKIKDKDEEIDVKFDAEANLKLILLNSKGNILTNKDYKIKIFRMGKKVYNNALDENLINLPPSDYQVRAYLNEELVGFKDISLNNDKEIKVVTSVSSKIPILIFLITIIAMIEFIIFYVLRKISLNTLLKAIAMGLILISIFLPWWSLSANNQSLDATKTTETFIYPQVMIEKISLNGQIHYDLATIPDLFTDFLGILLFVVISGFVLIGLSYIPNILLKKRYSLILIFASFLFLILISAAFIIGMSRLTEISLGSLTGNGLLDVSMPDGSNINMNGSWGLGLGFFLCVIAALISLFSGFSDFLIKKLKK